MLHIEFLTHARKNWNRVAVCDSTGGELTFGRLLAAGLWLSRYLRKKAEGGIIAVNLPPSVAAVIVNLGLVLAGKTATNVNYGAPAETVAHVTNLCAVKTVITSRTFEARLVEKFGFRPLPHSLYLEDILSGFTPWKKILAFLAAKILPEKILKRNYFPEGEDLDREVAVIFSSGATGKPKGVVLTHRNILSNVRAVLELSGWDQSQRLLGVLPFFHSFGYTVTFWLPLLGGPRACYHTNPLEAEAIGKLAEKHHATILLGTNYFFQCYLRKIPREEFASLRFAILGAEKLKETLAVKWEEKYGLPILEGYGCTELSPVVSCNMYDGKDAQGATVLRHRKGTIGRPLPGVEVRIVDPRTGRELSPGEEGMLEVRSPGLMKGYFKDPERTRETVKDGWYVTGDIARLDAEGFISITDRLARFSKVGGEMVPHVHIEEIIHKALGTEEQVAVVTAVPDEAKGEKLVVLHLPAVSRHFQPGEFKKLISSFQLPNLWTPREFYEIEEVPVLASGKSDLQGIKKMAARLSGSRK